MLILNLQDFQYLAKISPYNQYQEILQRIFLKTKKNPRQRRQLIKPRKMIYDSPSEKQNQENLKSQEMIGKYHTPILSQNQCGSSLVQTIDAPLSLVWSTIRQFDNPQVYKRFIKSCSIIAGSGGIGSVRELKLISGLPAKSSTERLESLDDDLYVMIISIIGGDHRLINYKSTTTLHETEEGKGSRTTIIESYVVDIPSDSCKEDTCSFADTIIGFNLRSLAKVTEKMASNN